MENKISISIPEADYQAAKQHLTDAANLLKPFLQALTPDQRRNLLKMGDKSMPFVEKALEYSKSSPSLLPAYIDMVEWEKDATANRQLTELYRICEQLCSNLDDTNMLTGSENFAQALGFYNNAKQAFKMNVPDAKPIYDDLSKRFPGRVLAKPVSNN